MFKSFKDFVFVGLERFTNCPKMGLGWGLMQPSLKLVPHLKDIYEMRTPVGLQCFYVRSLLNELAGKFNLQPKLNKLYIDERVDKDYL